MKTEEAILTVRPCECKPDCPDLRFGILDFQLCEADNSAFCVVPLDALQGLIDHIRKLRLQTKEYRRRFREAQ